MSTVNLQPTKCNICGGRVVYTSNADIYSKEYGSGKCYLCTTCQAYVGTHKPRPKEALGLLADPNMRKGKRMCHDIFDNKWQSLKGKQRSKVRREMYWWLSRQLEIDVADCHFGHFDIATLRRAYKILLEIEDVELIFCPKGRVINEIRKQEELYAT